MKRFGICFLVVMLMISFCGCQGQMDPGDENMTTTAGQTDTTVGTTAVDPTTAPTINPPPVITVDHPVDQYDLDTYTLPYWSGYVVYQESAMVLENEDGSIPDIPLLYHAEEIVSVRSSDLQTVYQEGRDYTLVDGKLHIPSGSTIPTVAHSTYYPAEATSTSFPLNANYGRGYIFFSEGAILHSMQIAVTYKHYDRFEGAIPEYKGDQLPKTMAKLQNGESLKIVLYGDSISTGVNSSGIIQAQPMAQAWYQMFVSKLEQAYPAANISFVNTSVGGMASNWGAENAEDRAAKYNPDLCIIAFGMNDGSAQFSAGTYKNNIQQIMDTVSAQNPECEFILVATMLPNPEVSNFMGNQKAYLPVLESMETSGVVVADMTSFHEALLAKKRYCDMTGNNVNHPNDFLARAYAQVMCQTVIGEN